MSWRQGGRRLGDRPVLLTRPVVILIVGLLLPVLLPLLIPVVVVFAVLANGKEVPGVARLDVIALFL